MELKEKRKNYQKLNLKEYLEQNSKTYSQDKYSMSIREFSSLYSQKEINLAPVYQRLFRWNDERASKLIESIILGIPLPPLFVSVKNANWEIVDGVQRASSILWFLGKLEERAPLKLTNLEILTELNDHSYETLRENDPATIFKEFDFKRIDINLLTSDNVESEYELFSRLNTGGLALSAQEIRNFLISKLTPDFYEELKKLKEDKNIDNLLGISSKQKLEDYTMELFVYFLIITNSNSQFKSEKGIDIFERYAKKYNKSKDKFIDVCITEVLKNENSILSIDYVRKVFNIIKNNLKEKPFSRTRNNRFSQFIYICIISFIHYNPNKEIKNLVEMIEKNKLYIEQSSRGSNVVEQFISGIKIGRNL